MKTISYFHMFLKELKYKLSIEKYICEWKATEKIDKFRFL